MAIFIDNELYISVHVYCSVCHSFPSFRIPLHDYIHNYIVLIYISFVYWHGVDYILISGVWNSHIAFHRISAYHIV